MIRHRKDRVSVAGFKKVFMPTTRKAVHLLATKKYGPLRSMLAEYPMAVPPDGEHILREGTSTNWLGNGVKPAASNSSTSGE